jgi:hypothetical protein
MSKREFTLRVMKLICLANSYVQREVTSIITSTNYCTESNCGVAGGILLDRILMIHDW